MFNLFKKSKKYRNKHDIDPELYLFDFFKEEVVQSNLFNEESIQIAIDHLMEKVDLHKSGTYLNADEKKELGYNSNLKLTKHYLNILTDEARRAKNPTQIIKNIHSIAFGKYSRARHINSLKLANKKTYILIATADESTCEWCIKQSHIEVDINTDPNSLISKFCTCVPFNRSYVSIPNSDFV